MTTALSIYSSMLTDKKLEFGVEGGGLCNNLHVVTKYSPNFNALSFVPSAPGIL